MNKIIKVCKFSVLFTTFKNENLCVQTIILYIQQLVLQLVLYSFQKVCSDYFSNFHHTYTSNTTSFNECNCLVLDNKVVTGEQLKAMALKL